ncbi:MAG: hypothetical protein PHV43_01485 [Candidatus Colwellbacteria bacterium]|nr:hypothetical protein [Candidatus Colwellbacteria bacterium]
MEKPLVVLIVVAVAVGILGAGAYILFRNTPDSNINTAVDAPQGEVHEASLTQPGRYIGDGFSLEQMPGWTVGHIPSTLVSFHNYGEEHPNGSPAVKINFKSYGAVSFDAVGGKTLDEVYQTTIETVKNLVPSIEVTAVEDINVNGLPTKLAVMDLLQQEVNFKVLLAVYLASDRYYILSFNTTAEKWPEYKDGFYAVARSFMVE